MLQMTDGVRSKLQKFLEGGDEYSASANVDYLNVGEIIDIMPLQSIPVSYTHLTLPTTPYV